VQIWLKKPPPEKIYFRRKELGEYLNAKSDLIAKLLYRIPGLGSGGRGPGTRGIYTLAQLELLAEVLDMRLNRLMGYKAIDIELRRQKSKTDQAPAKPEDIPAIEYAY